MRRSKEVEGLLLKTAELETMVVVLLGMLEAKKCFTRGEIEDLFEVAEMPEILAARIKVIEEKGSALMEARKTLLSENLGILASINEDPSREETDVSEVKETH